MGRQKGQSQRTKGNVRPSSSSRAATMLSKNQQLIGFDSFSGELGYMPMLKSLEDDKDCLIDPDFRVVLSKLSKKDVTTKVKALVEFSDLCKSKSVEQTLSILGYWPRIYIKLCNDSDRKVRELCQISFTSLINSVGKEIAPHLKSVIGSWWIVQSDSHAPAASAAKAAFSDAFPTAEKQKKVLIFGHKEIIQSICSNIFAKRLPSSSKDSTDERDFERLVSTSLTAFALFLKSLDTDSINKLSSDCLEGIYLNPRLWKFAKDKNPAIRSAYYLLLSSFCCYLRDVVKSELATVAKSILHKIDESNPLICKNLWEAANNLTNLFADWHECIDIRKGFLPQLWSLIRHGFYGNAKVVGPFLSNILQRFPPSLTVYPVYEELFKCLSISLESESVLKSAVETKAIVTATVKCIDVILKQSEDKESSKIIDLLWNKNLMPLIELSLLPKNKNFLLPVHDMFAWCLNQWYDKPENLTIYVDVTSVIWKDVIELGRNIISRTFNADDIESSLISFLHLLDTVCCVTMADSDQKTIAKRKSVKFNDEKDLEIAAKISSENAAVKNQMLVNNLENCLTNCIKHLLGQDSDKNWRVLALYNILKVFASASLFKKMFSDLQHRTDPACVFLKNSVVPLIKKLSLAECEIEQCQKIAGLLYFTIAQCDESVTNILEEIYADLSTCGGRIVLILLSQCLIDGTKVLVTSNCRWFLNYILLSLEELADEAKSSKQVTWNLIHTVFAHKSFLKPGDAVTVLEALNTFLNLNTSYENVITVNKIYAVSFNSFESCGDVIISEEKVFSPALLALLRLICLDPQEELILSLKDTISALLKTCYTSDSDDAKTFVLGLCCKCASHLTSLIFESSAERKGLYGFSKAVAVIAEELVMHHIKQNFITEWLNCALPSIEQLNKLRPTLESTAWDICQSTSNKFVSSTSEDIVNDKYFEIVATYIDVAEELHTIFSENCKEVSRHPRYQLLFIETLLARAISRDQQISVLLFKPQQFSTTLKMLLQNTISLGSGWILIFTEFASWASKDYWDEELCITSIFSENYKLTAGFAQVLIAFVNRSSCIPYLMAILQWCFDKYTIYHLQCIESEENSNILAQALQVLTVIIERINCVQGNDDPIFVNGDNSCAIHLKLLENILELKSSFPSVFLFDISLAKATKSHLHLNSAIAKFLKSVVDIYPCTITSENWDFIQCSLVSWIESFSATFKNTVPLDNASLLDMLHSVCALMLSLEKFIISPIALSDPALPTSLTSEWNEFFKPAAHSSLLPVFKALSSTDAIHIQHMLTAIGHCLSSATSATLLSCASSFQPHLTASSQLSNDIQTLLHHFSALLLPKNSTDFSVKQSIAYSLITRLADGFAQEQSTTAELPVHFIRLLEEVAPHVFNYVSSLQSQTIDLAQPPHDDDDDDDESDESFNEEADNEIQDNLNEQVDSNDDAYVYSFVLIWKLVINWTKSTVSEVKSQYTALFATNQVINIPSLLSTLVLLLPDFPYIVNKDTSEKANMFNVEIDVFKSLPNSIRTGHCTCSLYRDVLSNFPVYARAWYNGLSKTDKTNVEEYTSRYVTPCICARELEFVSGCKTPSGLSVRARKATREVMATYEISEANFEITIQLTSSFPLTPVRVNTIAKVGVAASQWRYWMFQMTMLLQRQNGNIMDALLLWKQKVDKKFEGLEECMICFSIVHSSNAQSLPKLQCKTCRKKYHAECLYRWFDTSNQSTCPLCRSPMMF